MSLLNPSAPLTPRPSSVRYIHGERQQSRASPFHRHALGYQCLPRTLTVKVPSKNRFRATAEVGSGMQTKVGIAAQEAAHGVDGDPWE